MSTNGSTPLFSDAARRMARSIEDAEGRSDLRFRADGSRIMPGGRHEVWRDLGAKTATFTVRYPFRPSLASCEDMVREWERTGRPVAYDQARWDGDPRIDEQAGHGPPVDGVEERLLAAAAELAA